MDATDRPANVAGTSAEDVQCPPDATERSTSIERPAGMAEARDGAAEEPMKCVWSGYPDYNRDCRSRIPASVVIKAWHREIQLKGTVEGFYYFTWRQGRWLAYGLRDGRVRGVYCPTHCTDRDLRGTLGEDALLEAPKEAQVEVLKEASVEVLKSTPAEVPTSPPIRGAVGKSEHSAVRAERLGVALR
jgi:hypothetical protein